MDDDNSRISIPRVLTNRKILRIKYGHPTKSLVDGGKTRVFSKYNVSESQISARALRERLRDNQIIIKSMNLLALVFQVL